MTPVKRVVEEHDLHLRYGLAARFPLDVSRDGGGAFDPEVDAVRILLHVDGDSRGLARALLGDYEGAIEDFEALIDWAEVQDWDPRYAIKRRSWIKDLENGINPFDEATLEELKRE